MGVSHCQSRKQYLAPLQTIHQSDNMFIEDEADAVFNEIRNQGKDNDDKEEPRSTTNDAMLAPDATETKPVSPAPAPLLTINVDQMEDVELEEPVSPPACDPS